MAAFNADIDLRVVSRGAERQVRKIEAAVGKVEQASAGILKLDRQIVGERRKLLGLSGEQATAQKKRLQDLRLQRQELSLQKRELQGIVSAEKRRATELVGGGGGIGSFSDAASLAGASSLASAAQSQKLVALSQQQLVLSQAVVESEDRRLRIQDQLNRKRAAAIKSGQLEQRIQSLDRLTAELKEASREEAKFKDALSRTNGELGRSQRGLNATSKAAGRASNPLLSLGKQALQVGAAFFTLDQAARQVTASLNAAIGRETSTRRLAALSEGFDDLSAVLGVADRAAARFNLSQTAAQQNVAKLYARLRPLGVSLFEIEQAFNGFNTAAILSGATAQESAGALLQLTQALGSGVLRGQELNSILEQSPAVARALAAELDKPVGALKRLGEQGALTSDVVIKALARIEKEGAQRLAKALDSPAQKIRTLQNRVEDLQTAFGDLALPALLGLVEQLTRRTQAWARAFQGLNAIVKDFVDSRAFQELKNFLEGLENINRILQLVGPLGPLSSPLGREFFTDQLGQFAPEKPTRPTPEKPKTDIAKRLGIDPPTGSGGGSSSNDAAREAAERARRLRDSDQLLERLRLQLTIQKEGNTLAGIRAQNELEILEINQNYNNQLEGEASALVRANLERARALELETARTRQTQDLVQLAKDAGKALGEDLAAKIPDAVQNTEYLKTAMQGVGAEARGLIDTLISGTSDWNAVLTDTLKSLSKVLIQAGLAGLGGGDGRGFFSLISGGFRAEGGPVTTGKPYIVGEQGPELFVPGRSGMVVPNDAMGGNVSVVNNITVQANEGGLTPEAQERIARQMTSIATGVIVREKRPGGMLSRR